MTTSGTRVKSSPGMDSKLNDYQREQRLAEGESARSVARLLGVSHVTVASGLRHAHRSVEHQRRAYQRGAGQKRRQTTQNDHQIA